MKAVFFCMPLNGKQNQQKKSQMRVYFTQMQNISYLNICVFVYFIYHNLEQF